MAAVSEWYTCRDIEDELGKARGTLIKVVRNRPVFMGITGKDVLKDITLFRKEPRGARDVWMIHRSALDYYMNDVMKRKRQPDKKHYKNQHEEEWRTRAAQTRQYLLSVDEQTAEQFLEYLHRHIDPVLDAAKKRCTACNEKRWTTVHPETGLAHLCEECMRNWSCVFRSDRPMQGAVHEHDYCQVCTGYGKLICCDYPKCPMVWCPTCLKNMEWTYKDTLVCPVHPQTGLKVRKKRSEKKD